MFQPKRILSPIDFSEDSLEALDTARHIAERNGSEMVLVHVVPVMPKLPANVSILHEGDYEKELIRNAESRLEELAGKLREKGLQVRTVVGLANDAGMEVLLTAERQDADLIVIATHGLTGWRRLTFGSVTDKVIRTAECPVLVLRKKATTHSQHAASAAG